MTTATTKCGERKAGLADTCTRKAVTVYEVQGQRRPVCTQHAKGFKVMGYREATR